VRVRIQRKELIENGKKRVQNLFGGAFKVIAGAASAIYEGHGDGDGIRASGASGGVKEESIHENYQAELEEKRRR